MTAPLLDFKQLQIFLSVAHHQSVKEAAHHLSLSPAAVSQAVSALEKTLGIPLFSRAVRPLGLTLAGRTLLAEAPLLLQHEEHLRALLTPQNTAFQTLRLGVSEAVTSGIGPWLLKRLGELVPSLTVFSDLAPALQIKLQAKELDVTLCSGAAPTDSGWYREEIWREEFLLVTAHDMSGSLKRLAASAPFICYNRNYRDQQRTELLLEHLNLAPQRRICVSSSYELMGLIALSGGFGILPPTNIWCGRQFFHDVHIMSLPTETKAFRQMWACGAASDHKPQTQLVAREARIRATCFRSEVLAHGCPGLEKYLQVACDSKGAALC